MNQFEIIDGQLHEFGPRSDTQIDDPGMQYQVMLEITLSAMDAVGVDAALLFPTDEEFAAYAIAEFPGRFASILGSRFIRNLKNIDETFAHLRQQPGILGVRVAFMSSTTNDPPTSPPEPAFFEPVFVAADRYDLPVFIFVNGDATRVAGIAEAHPDLTLIVDHIGIPQPPFEQRDDPPFQRLPDLLALARYPNVAVKMCGAPSLSNERYPYSDVWPSIHKVFAAFGAERLLWASDISRFQGRIGFRPGPWHTNEEYEGKHSYAESLNFFRYTDELSENEKRLLLGENLRRLLRWPASSSVSTG